MRPDASIKLGSVSNEANSGAEIDAAFMLKEALQKALAKQDVLSVSNQQINQFILNSSIMEYEKGNAFKRWLLPGYGSTILSVKCEVIDSQSGTLVATLQHKRSVSAGGAYSIGAWEYIFDSLANDIARELERRINNKGFVVHLTPLSEKDLDIKLAKQSLRIKLLPIDDHRPEKGRIGERHAAFNVSMGDIFLHRQMSGFFNEYLTDYLLASGHSIVETDQDITIEPLINKFWIRTDTTVLYWDIIGEIDIRLSLLKATPEEKKWDKYYSCQQSSRTYVYPTVKISEQVMENCLDELMQKILVDNVWEEISAFN
jgi:hypothetical protein